MKPAAFATRRRRVMETIAARGGGVAIQATAPMAVRNRDVEYPFRHDSHFYWLTGFVEPEAVVVLCAGPHVHKSVLFCREKDPAMELWEGFRHGPEGAAAAFGFDEAYPIGSIDQKLPELLAGAPAVYSPLAGDNATFDASLKRWLAAVRHRRDGTSAPRAHHDLHALIDDMRLVKDAGEIGTMRRAAQISARAHARAMRACRPGMREYEIEAELLHEFRRHGAQSPAYPSVVAAGRNACVLHYFAADAVLEDGDLCLIDAGCEFDGYASDITRTFPANGRFSGEQRAVYEIVLAAQLAAIDEVRPGRRFDDADAAARRVLAQGAIDLGLLNGSVDGVLESGAYRQFYMHRTSHWLGMDVHDVGDYRDRSGDRGGDRSGDTSAVAGGSSGSEPTDGTNPAPPPWRKLEPGMVMTVEPGLYIRPAENVPARFAHIGVRIEDDVLVTPEGHEVLSADAPKSVADIEALVGQAPPGGR